MITTFGAVQSVKSQSVLCIVPIVVDVSNARPAHAEGLVDKPTPKFKQGYIVYDRELGKEYRVERFLHHQLNGDVWYLASDTTTDDRVWTCERWLILVRKWKPKGLRLDD